MIRRSIAMVVALAVPPGAAGCLTSTQATRLQTDLEEVKKQLFGVQQTAAGNRTRLDEIASRVAGPGSTGAGSGDELRTSLQAILDQNRALADQMDEIKARLSSLSHEVQALQGRSAPPGGGAARSGGAPVPPPAGGSPGFGAAYADYTKGNYELAVMGFSEFLRDHPDSPEASDAQYWIGECLYSQGKFKDAVDAFDLVVSRHSGAPRVPAALLKKGLAQIQAGQTTQGVSTLQRLIEAHPQSEEARLAAERLQQMGLRSRQRSD